MSTSLLLAIFYKAYWIDCEIKQRRTTENNMLEIRPNCELCDRDLPPASDEARICSYECTYCAACVDGILQNVCPSCGGGFEKRPIRPMASYRDGKSLGLQFHPASKTRVHSPYSADDINEHVERIKVTAPKDR